MGERLEAGDACPDFSMEADDGSVVSQASLLGRRFVLYFYPRDNSRGCTAQACSLRDEFAAFRELDVVTFGVSPDSVESHRAFRSEYQLPFGLLSDKDHKAAEAFGVWVPKTIPGKTGMGNERTTFVVGPDGRIAYVMAAVQPEMHTEQLLSALG